MAEGQPSGFSDSFQCSDIDQVQIIHEIAGHRHGGAQDQIKTLVADQPVNLQRTDIAEIKIYQKPFRCLIRIRLAIVIFRVMEVEPDGFDLLPVEKRQLVTPPVIVLSTGLPGALYVFPDTGEKSATTASFQYLHDCVADDRANLPQTQTADHPGEVGRQFGAGLWQARGQLTYGIRVRSGEHLHDLQQGIAQPAQTGG